MTLVPDYPTAPDSVRKQRLGQAIQDEVVRGGRVETQGDFDAVVRFGKRTNHVLHLILTLVTFGIWVLVWSPLTAVRNLARRTIMLSVDEAGQVHRRMLRFR